MEGDGDDEHEHIEGGKAMTSDDSDLMKRRAKDRGKWWFDEEKRREGLKRDEKNDKRPRLWKCEIKASADFFLFILKNNIKINIFGSGF